MKARELGSTGIRIAPLVLGGNVFGWTADKATSFAVLDAFIEAGFNAIDTADVYSSWVPGHVGGESETVIGEWMKDRGVRDEIVLITKGGWDKGLGAKHLAEAAEASLKRLQTDRIDVYLSHKPDPDTPIEETLRAHQKLIDAGKVRVAGGSNNDADGLAAALAAADADHARYQVLQPHYNLHERSTYEGALENLCESERLGVIPYFALAAGFLTGKYRSIDDAKGTAREGRVKASFDARGIAILAALEKVAKAHGATMAQIALAWLMARPSVTAPIASATSVAQLKDIAGAVNVKLSAEDLRALEI
jgi:aryl-alcohol dehydrogenase-like predicted oxidoreductase